MEDAQAALSVAITREALDLEAAMSSTLINVSLEKSAEMQAALSRSAGLAAEGIGGKLDITV